MGGGWVGACTESCELNCGYIVHVCACVVQAGSGSTIGYGSIHVFSLQILHVSLYNVTS